LKQAEHEQEAGRDFNDGVLPIYMGAAMAATSSGHNVGQQGNEFMPMQNVKTMRAM
jgi:hypothetical protein